LLPGGGGQIRTPQDPPTGKVKTRGGGLDPPPGAPRESEKLGGGSSEPKKLDAPTRYALS
jgi:hypothetical protein